MSEPTSLSCTDVLARLGDYVDDALDAAERARVETHLRGCGNCAAFGGAVGELVRSLRRQLEPLPVDVEARLRARLGG
jgi:anti-sigma factor RsiW